jgi:hypothetical protein
MPKTFSGESEASIMRIEEEHLDVLQNIESVVARTYRLNRQMTDYDALRVYEALIKAYTAEQSGREAKPGYQSELEARLFDDIHSICEWRLGHGAMPGADEDVTPGGIQTIDAQTLIVCLKRLVKSVNRWNKHGGRQGYLDFMTQFVR